MLSAIEKYRMVKHIVEDCLVFVLRERRPVWVLEHRSRLSLLRRQNSTTARSSRRLIASSITSSCFSSVAYLQLMQIGEESVDVTGDDTEYCLFDVYSVRCRPGHGRSYYLHVHRNKIQSKVAL